MSDNQTAPITEGNLTRFGKLPSQHIQQALDALIAAEQPDSWVKPAMYTFHDYYTNSPCFACLGGLAAIREFGFTKEDKIDSAYDADNLAPGAMGYEYALDSVRNGELYNAFVEWGFDGKKGLPFRRRMPSYHTNQDGFKEALRTLITDLQTAGY